MKKPRLSFGEEEDLEDKPVNNKTMNLNDRYYINLSKLKMNRLSISYIKSRSTLPAYRNLNITNDVRECLINIINKKFNRKEFQSLAYLDRQLIQEFVRKCKLEDVNVDIESIEQDNRNFQILLGEFEAGNNSDKIILELKHYLKLMVLRKIITKAHAFEILFEINEIK